MRMPAAVLAVLSAAASAAAAAELVMFEVAGCGWCQGWHQAIRPGYAKTSGGLAAPVRRVDFCQEPQSGINLLQRITTTPTFVLVDSGEERGRILGYLGAQCL